VALASASAALAHGDPTAHYLETDPLLTSYSKPPFTNVELRLRGLIEAAAKRGYPIKVVLMADLGDTGDDPFPLEDTQRYVHTISGELDGIKSLKAPVLIVTPHAFGLGGRQPQNGEIVQLTDAAAASLLRGIEPSGRVDGTALARSAMAAVRQLAREGGHPLPKVVPPAKTNLQGILGRASDRSPGDTSNRTIVVVLTLTAVVLVGLLLLVQRRVGREPGSGLA
jgi:hypothetical protein